MISKRLFSRIAAIGASAFLVGCGGGGSMDKVVGSHHSITDEKAIAEPFSKISVAVPCKFEIHQGDKQGVKVRIDDNLLEHFHTNVVGDTLNVTRCANWTNAGECVVEVTCPNLSAVAITGAANGVVDNVKAETFNVTLSGAGDLRAAGAADKVKIAISGAGNVDLGDVKCKSATVTMSGAGGAVVNSSENLNASISGVGSVRYKGKPEIKKQISGTGAVVSI